MLNFYPRASWALFACCISAPTAWAQAPVITAVAPQPNASAAPANGPVAITFNQPLTAASAGALQVFSSQRGGRRSQGGTATVVSGNTIRFSPGNYAFMPGETVNYTVSRAAESSSGTLAQPRVGQFTAGVGASSSGIFLPGSDPAVGYQPTGLTVGDVDGDGDLDLLTANFRGGVSVRLNNGRGTFGGGQEVSLTGNVRSVVLGDVDGDGDLDLLAPDYSDNTGTVVSVRRNDGSGNFAGNQSVAVGRGPYGLALGDADGDGDLDLLTANGFTNSVSVRVNDGQGNFSGNQEVAVGANPHHVVLGDVDGDGDLDFLTANGNDNSVSVRLNNGQGTFGSGQSLSIGGGPFGLALGDLDGDGDVDLLAASPVGNGLVAIRFNNGSGIFGGGQDVPVTSVGYGSFSVVVGDVDGDGDLDFLAANSNNGGPGTVLVRLNNGRGSFSGSQNVSVGRSSQGVAVGDLDGDGDLDLLTANSNDSNVSIRLNQSAPPPPLPPPIVAVTLSGPSYLCTGQQGVLTAVATATPSAYLWSTGATTPSITVTQGGTYSVTVTFANGQTTSTQQVVQVQTAPLPFSLGQDTTLCTESEELVLRGPIGAGYTYQWQDGSTASTLPVRGPGSYSLRVSTACGVQTASRQVLYRLCSPMPNIITPNNDRHNDRFVINDRTRGPWQIAIYSRWGQRLYHSPDYQNEWGADAPAGVYYYLLQSAIDGQIKKGWLEVVR